VLDYSKERAETYLSGEVHRTFRAFEYWLGPYPFYEDGFKMVEAPYIGMEHQGAIGYGNHFILGRFGAKRLTPWDWKVDRMVTHENAHEWFGNSITAKDPADRWLQEGFAGYAEELAVESFYGRKAAEEFFHDRTRHGGDSLWINDKPVISEYNIFKDGGDGMYFQGWELIHMVRAIVNDDVKFRKLLRGLSAEFYHQTVTSAQLEHYISAATGRDFSRLFDQYLRAAGLPVLEYSLEGNVLSYRLTQCVPGLTMPLKTNWTGEKWLYSATDWQEVQLSGPSPDGDLRIDNDFYLQASKTRRK
jgi:aminopeptidase N